MAILAQDASSQSSLRRGLRPIKQAVASADKLNLAYALRQRQIVKSRETNPITHERQAVPKHEGKLGFLRITQVRDS